MSMAELFGPVISSYTRPDAMEDGVLIAVSETASEAGITFPVAVTSAVWAEYVEVPDGVECQDEAGRLWDILWMFRCKARVSGGSVLAFEVYVRNDNHDRMALLRQLKAVCGPGDDAEPVITIMLPEED